PSCYYSGGTISSTVEDDHGRRASRWMPLSSGRIPALLYAKLHRLTLGGVSRKRKGSGRVGDGLIGVADDGHMRARHRALRRVQDNASHQGIGFCAQLNRRGERRFIAELNLPLTVEKRCRDRRANDEFASGGR